MLHRSVISSLWLAMAFALIIEADEPSNTQPTHQLRSRAKQELSTLTGTNLPDTTVISGVEFVTVNQSDEPKTSQKAAATTRTSSSMATTSKKTTNTATTFRSKTNAQAEAGLGGNLIAVAGYDGAAHATSATTASTAKTTQRTTLPKPATTANSGVSAADQKAWVDGHNIARKKYGNAPPLVWDDALVPAAKANAIQCTGKHTVQRQYGENIADESGGLTIQSALEMWMDEASYTNFKTFESTAPGKEVGHFTQVVWKSSQRVGCWIATCAPGTVFPAGYGTSYQATCEYDPPGNVIGLSNYQANVIAA